MNLKSAAAIGIIAGLPGLAVAQTVIDNRQDRQQQRINKGVASGQLNAAEAARMQKGQAITQKMEDRAKADGVVTKSEAAKIQSHQNKQSARIYHEKHDKKTATR